MATKKTTKKKTTLQKQASSNGKTTDGGRNTANKAPQKMSALDAAAQVLGESKEPMRSGELIVVK